MKHCKTGCTKAPVGCCCYREALRATRAAQPAAGGSGDSAVLGKPGEALTFESLARAKGAQVLLPASFTKV